MSSEDTEWKLLEKRLEHAKKPDPVAPTLRRATIKIDDELNNMIKEVLNHHRESLVINTNIIEGLLRTSERIEITLITTDGDEE